LIAVELERISDKHTSGSISVATFTSTSNFVSNISVTMAMVVSKEVDYSIKPEAVTPAVDTSTWPLLLKNYDKREIDWYLVEDVC
jgi:hypothetical protein